VARGLESYIGYQKPETRNSGQIEEENRLFPLYRHDQALQQTDKYMYSTTRNNSKSFATMRAVYALGQPDRPQLSASRCNFKSTVVNQVNVLNTEHGYGEIKASQILKVAPAHEEHIFQSPPRLLS